MAAGKPQLGYQLPCARQRCFQGGHRGRQCITGATTASRSFALASADADAFLNDIAAGKVTDPRVPLGQWFNGLVYPLFTEACFADPIYGGNRDKVFWRVIGYPGLPATHGRDMVEYRGKPFPGAKDPKSIADFS